LRQEIWKQIAEFSRVFSFIELLNKMVSK